MRSMATSERATAWRSLEAACQFAVDNEIWLLVVLYAPAMIVSPGPQSLLWAAVAGVPALARWNLLGTLSRKTPFDIALLVFLVGAAVGLAISLTPQAAALRMSGLMGCALGFYVVVNWCNSRRRVVLVLAGYLSSVGIVVTVLVTQTPVGAYTPSLLVDAFRPVLEWLDGLPKHVPQGTVWNIRPNGYAGAVGALVPLVGLLAMAQKGRRRLVLAGLLGLLLLVLLLTNSRGAILATGTALVVCAIFWRLDRRLLPVTLAAVPAAFLLLLTPLLGKVEKTFSLLSGSGELERLDLWTIGAQMVQDHPLTGIGLSMENFQRFLGWYAPTHLTQDPGVVASLPHAHNLFLQTYLEQGVLGVIGILAAVTIAYPLAWRASRRAPDRLLRAMVVGCIGSFTVVLVHGLVDSVPSTNVGMVLLWFPLALLVAVDALVRRSPGKGLTPWVSSFYWLGQAVRRRS